MMDERNTRILADRVASLDKVTGPRVGDYIRFADGVTRRVSYIWDWQDGSPVSLQTSAGGSFYLGNGYVSFSGSLYRSVLGSTLTLTEERRDGSVWFFRNDWMEAHSGIDASMAFRVYESTEAAPE